MSTTTAALDAEREKVKRLEQELTTAQRNIHDNNVSCRQLLDKYLRLQELVWAVDAQLALVSRERDYRTPLREARHLIEQYRRATLDATTPACQHEWGIDGAHNNEYCKRCFVSKGGDGE